MNQADKVYPEKDLRNGKNLDEIRPLKSRRNFLRYGLGLGLGFGVAALGSLSPLQASVLPPRALPLENFIARCVRCGACVQACPHKALAQQDLSLDIRSIGLPYIQARRGGCTAWKDGCKLCAEVCPSSALNPGAELKLSKPGLVVFEEKLCTNCMACFRACPIEGAILFPNPTGGKAYRKEHDIPFELKLVTSAYKPYIDTKLCVGCGLCVPQCIPKIMSLSPSPRF